MREKISRLEQDPASANRELDRMRSRPAPATERENYVLGEMDFVNRQLESEFVWSFAHCDISDCIFFD